MAAGVLWPASAGAIDYFKIASGSRGGTYFPIAGLIGQVVSNPPGSKSCERGGNCGMPGLVAIAEPSGGSVANVTALGNGEYPSGFAQSDIAYWAYSASGPFRNRKPATNLCAITSLYPEELHLVRDKNAKIAAVADLKGKRVAFGEQGSGALVGAQLLVRAHGIEEGRDFSPALTNFEGAAKMMGEGKIDALLTIGGHPLASVVRMAKEGARLVPITGVGAETLITRSPFYTRASIPAATYPGQTGDVQTVAVHALWISRSDLAEDLLYGVTKALWSNKHARNILDGGHTKGKRITLATSSDGVSIPFCKGAEKFYREVGKLK